MGGTEMVEHNLLFSCHPLFPQLKHIKINK